MSPSEWIVLIAGACAIAWVNWYFFLAGRRTPAAVAGAGAAEGGADGVREVRIVVRGGYEPAAVRVPAGQRIRLVFDRQERSGCSEEVVIPDFNIRRFLPPFEKTAVEVVPERAGTFEFTCGMGMLRGRIIAE